MLNFAERNKQARVGLAYFGDFLDYRWKQAGILEAHSLIKFFDLTESSAELLGGIDLWGAATATDRRFEDGIRPKSALMRTGWFCSSK